MWKREAACSTYSLTLTMEATCPPGNVYSLRATRRYILDVTCINNHSCENLKYHMARTLGKLASSASVL
jgi:hypothetical protein